MVEDLEGLEEYAWCGHGVWTGRRQSDWQERDFVLGFFRSERRKAIWSYREFVEASRYLGPRPELVRGGLVRGLGGWSGVTALRRQGEIEADDERILGGGALVQAILEEADHRLARQVGVGTSGVAMAVNGLEKK